MLHFFNCKKLKYIHDEPYTLVDYNRRKINLKKGDVLILDDGAMYRSLKYKTLLFAEVELKTQEKESKRKEKDLTKEQAKEESKKDESVSAKEQVKNEEQECLEATMDLQNKA